jgi:hypothetical protein
LGNEPANALDKVTRRGPGAEADQHPRTY